MSLSQEPPVRAAPSVQPQFAGIAAAAGAAAGSAGGAAASPPCGATPFTATGGSIGAGFGVSGKRTGRVGCTIWPLARQGAEECHDVLRLILGQFGPQLGGGHDLDRVLKVPHPARVKIGRGQRDVRSGAARNTYSSSAVLVTLNPKSPSGRTEASGASTSPRDNTLAAKVIPAWQAARRP